MREGSFENELLDMKKQFGVDNDIEKMEETYHRIKLKERMNKDAGVVSPDTYACDGLFLESFITKEMRLDFHLVAKEFLQQEIMNLSEYEQFQHVQNLIKTTIPERIYEQLVLGLMFGAVKKGNIFAKDLFCYLYKTYYKKEYNQIKRFNKMSFSEVISIAKDSQNGYEEESIVRILTMSRVLGIELAHDCNFLFVLCDEMMEESCNDINKVFQIKIEEKDFERACDELRDTFVNEDEMEAVTASFEEYLRELFLFIGFPMGYSDAVKIHKDEIEMLFTKMLVLLKRANPHRKYEKEDIAIAAVLGKILTLHGILAHSVYTSFCGVLGVYNDYFEDNTTGMLDLSRLPKREKIREDRNCDSVIEVQEQKTKYNEADLLDEIESLRSRLHCAESMIHQLRTERTEERQKMMELEFFCRQSKEDKKELAKLREYVYGLTERDDEKEQILDDIEEDKHILQEKSVVIIGGHVNWVKKMKKEFPTWRFISPSVSNTVNASLVQNVDKVYFFTDALDHSNYYKFLQYIRESEVDFGYIHGVNIPNNIVYLYNDLYGEKRKKK